MTSAIQRWSATTASHQPRRAEPSWARRMSPLSAKHSLFARRAAIALTGRIASAASSAA
jgi:hypothetical protein